MLVTPLLPIQAQGLGCLQNPTRTTDAETPLGLETSSLAGEDSMQITESRSGETSYFTSCFSRQDFSCVALAAALELPLGQAGLMNCLCLPSAGLNAKATTKSDKSL